MSHDISELSSAAINLKSGIYRHFKGKDYEVLGVGRNSLDYSEELVIYRSLDSGDLWARPLSDFLATVERDDYKGPRFVFIKPSL
jgi:hypothetical protein